MSTYTDIIQNLDTDNSDIEIVEDIDAIKASIKNHLTTQKKQMPTDPDFGADLELVLFEIMDEVTFELAKQVILEELLKETRIEVSELNVNANYETSQLVITVYYTVDTLDDIVYSTTVKVEI